MVTTNINKLEGTVLKEDIYKDNILLLKKGIILNSYLINKLYNFGIYENNLIKNTEYKTFDKKNSFPDAEILIYQKNIFEAKKTKNVLEYVGFESDKIFMISNLKNLKINKENISYIFIDSLYYTNDFIEDISLLNIKNKLKIFVLDCDAHTHKNIIINTDKQIVRFLYRPLSSDYIKALLCLCR